MSDKWRTPVLLIIGSILLLCFACGAYLLRRHMFAVAFSFYFAASAVGAIYGLFFAERQVAQEQSFSVALSRLPPGETTRFGNIRQTTGKVIARIILAFEWPAFVLIILKNIGNSHKSKSSVGYRKLQHAMFNADYLLALAAITANSVVLFGSRPRTADL